MACGIGVAAALEAAELLAGRGIEAEVIDAFSIKPLDAETILASASKTSAVVTVEEHLVSGGLGSAVSELLGEQLPTRMRRIGVEDRFGTSGEPDELLAAFGLDAPSIADTVEAFLA